MYRYIFKRLTALILSFLILTISVSCGSKDQPRTESDYHKIGMALFREGLLDLLPEGKTEEAMNKFSEAEKAFKQAVAINPESAESHLYLAKAYSMQNKLSAAADEYAKTIEIAPQNTDNYIFLSSIYVRMKRYDDALNLLNHAKSLTGESATIDLFNDLIHNIREKSLKHYQNNAQSQTS